MNAIDNILERFEVLTHLSTETAKGNVLSLVVAGPPGVGKSYNVEKAVKRQSRLKNMGIAGNDVTIVKGKVSAAGLYELLYENREMGDVIIVDDSDSVFDDDDSLNLLKAALDTTSVRRLSWITKNKSKTGIPTSFVYEGSIIFITNLDFELEIQKKHPKAKHLEAIMDRSLYITVGLSDQNERMLYIRHIGEKMLSEFDVDEINEMFDFLETNVSNIRTISLRRLKQLSNLYRLGGDWKRTAKFSLFKQY